MAEYKMQSNEAIILKSKSVSHGFWGPYTSEILLTNINFIWTSIGVLGKKVHQYPLSQIKTHEGKYQVFQGEHSGNGSPMLDIYLTDGSVEQFGFQVSTKKTILEIQKWIYAFNGPPKEGYVNGDFYTEETSDSILGTFRDIGGELLDAFGVKSNKQPKQQPIRQYLQQPIQQQKIDPEKITKKCTSCGAQLSGFKGQIARCRYCDSDQQL